MSKNDMTSYLMTRYSVSFDVAFDTLRNNDWNLMMAAGDIRDELSAKA